MNALLRTERLDRGLSVRAAARLIGVSHRIVLEAESGARVPHPHNAKKIADFYGLRVRDIWPVKEAAA